MTDIDDLPPLIVGTTGGVHISGDYWPDPRVLLAPLDTRGMWITAAAWCAYQRSIDGRIPRNILHRITPLRPARTDAIAEELVSTGLWRLDGDSWQFVEWPAPAPATVPAGYQGLRGLPGGDR